MHTSTFAKRALALAILLTVTARLMLSVTAQTQNSPQNPPGQRPPQNPPGPGGPQRPGGPGAPGGGGGGFANAYPQKQVPPEVVERGKALYSVHCSFCHGSDARGGGEGGPSLIRSDVMMNDQKGELLAPVVLNGRGSMPKFTLTQEQISDIAGFVHSFRVSGYDAARNRPTTIVVGDAKAGATYFAATCGFSSTFSFTILTFSPIAFWISSSAGAIMRQGPHHSAQKSTTTGWLASSTSALKLVLSTLTVAMLKSSRNRR